MTPLRSPLRWWAGPLLLITAAVHVPLIPSHLEEAPYVGVLFIALAVVCIVLAALLMVRDTRAVWAVAAVVTLMAFATFLFSRTVGLPQVGDDIGNWSDPLGFPALFAESLATLVAFSVLHRTSIARKETS